MLFRRAPAFALAVATVSAACGRRAMTMDDYRTRAVVLPDRTEIRAEVLTHPTEMLRGMMFRDSLAPDRGMLFLHGGTGAYPYWMHQVKIPLDIIWMDSNRRIVEISANTPPCPSAKASDCPTFGGKHPALYVLELAGGVAARHGLKVGDTLNF